MDESSGLEQTEREANRRMLAGLLAQRRLGFFNRLAARAEQRLGRWNAYWATLSRRGRRAFWRKAAPALVGAGLVTTLLLAAAPVGANAITVANGAVGISADAVCSLIEAIQNANDTATGQPHADCAAGNPSGADTINLPNGGAFNLTAVNVTYGTINLGLPTITSNVTVNGNGTTISRGGAAPNFTIMATSTTGNLTINDLTLSNGQANIPVSGLPYGGGIWNRGALALNNSTLTGNDGVFGGALFNRGTAVIHDTAFNSNTVVPSGSFNGHGGAIYNWGGDVKIYDSTFTGNSSTHYGGAVMNSYFQTISNDGYALVETSTFSGNQSGDAGALGNFKSVAKVFDSTFHDNTATLNDGGAIDNILGTMTLDGSTLYENSAPQSGGGLYSSGVTTVINTTVSGNSATWNGGGIAALGSSAVVTLENVTVTANSTPGDGGGVFVNSGLMVFERSIVSGNTAGGAGREAHRGYLGSVTTDRHNVFGFNGNSGLSGVSVNPTDVVPAGALATVLNTTLANNGGPTLTHALPAGSVAVDRALSADCSAAPVGNVDQRGLPRNVNGAGGASANECDSGAFERQDPAPPLPSIYVSPLTAGNVDGIAVTPQDILVYDQNTDTWAMHFDGGDLGVVKIISSFAHLPGGDLLLVFKANQATPAGTFTAWDVARFHPTAPLGNNTQGTFSWYIDGSDVGLTTTAEKIDALDVLSDGKVVVSTGGALSAPKTGGGTLKSQDEDLSVLNHTTLGATTAGTWALYFNGTAITGLGAEDVVGAHVDEATGDLYLGILGAFNVGGVSGNGKDILKLTPSGGGYTVTRHWRGGDHGFNLNLGGIEME